jgi:signal transduction histidine kinase
VAARIVTSAVVIAAAWVIGFAVREQRAYTAGLREQAERRARAQLAEGRRAIAEERLRIARELHDVVAHSLSLIAVQAGVGNYVAEGLLTKLGARDRAQLVIVAYETGLVRPG